MLMLRTLARYRRRERLGGVREVRTARPGGAVSESDKSAYPGYGVAWVSVSALVAFSGD